MDTATIMIIFLLTCKIKMTKEESRSIWMATILVYLRKSGESQEEIIKRINAQIDYYSGDKDLKAFILELKDRFINAENQLTTNTKEK
jgi:hypothetical protein